MALETRYEVRTQVLSSWPAARSSGDVRQRHVGDAGVEHLHERCQRDGERDEPHVVPRVPAHIFMIGCSCWIVRIVVYRRSRSTSANGQFDPYFRLDRHPGLN